MSINLRYPQINGQTDREQITQIKKYLYSLTDQLQWALNNLSASSSNVVVQAPKSTQAVKEYAIHGGGIDNLTLGTRLTATEEAPIDLNDILTPGNYYSPNAENSQHMVNTPYTEGGFGLEVRELQHKENKRQTIDFGRTTIWRHYNGTEFSDWVRVMVSTEIDSACTDFVIDHGVSDGWTYKKWKSGTYEMFGEFEVTPGETTLNESLYQTGFITIPAPFTIESAVVSGTGVGFYLISNGGKSGDSAVNIRIISDKAISASTVTVRLHVVGAYA